MGRGGERGLLITSYSCCIIHPQSPRSALHPPFILHTLTVLAGSQPK